MKLFLVGLLLVGAVWNNGGVSGKRTFNFELNMNIKLIELEKQTV